MFTDLDSFGGRFARVQLIFLRSLRSKRYSGKPQIAPLKLNELMKYIKKPLITERIFFLFIEVIVIL